MNPSPHCFEDPIICVIFSGIAKFVPGGKFAKFPGGGDGDLDLKRGSSLLGDAGYWIEKGSSLKGSSDPLKGSSRCGEGEGYFVVRGSSLSGDR